jgi:hypothetical protein
MALRLSQKKQSDKVVGLKGISNSSGVAKSSEADITENAVLNPEEAAVRHATLFMKLRKMLRSGTKVSASIKLSQLSLALLDASSSAQTNQSQQIGCSTLLFVMLPKLGLTIDRSGAVDGPIGVTLELEHLRVCSKCDTPSSECDHMPGRLFGVRQLLWDIHVQPKTKSKLVAVESSLQLSGVRGTYLDQCQHIFPLFR